MFTKIILVIHYLWNTCITHNLLYVDHQFTETETKTWHSLDISPSKRKDESRGYLARLQTLPEEIECKHFLNSKSDDQSSLDIL